MILLSNYNLSKNVENVRRKKEKKKKFKSKSLEAGLQGDKGLKGVAVFQNILTKFSIKFEIKCVVLICKQL